MSGCRATAAIRARYKAHDDDGEPGIGRRPDEAGEGELVIFASRGWEAWGIAFTLLRVGRRGRWVRLAERLWLWAGGSDRIEELFPRLIREISCH